MMLEVGKLYQFARSLHGCDTFKAIYLGEAPLHRDDGITIRNHKVLKIGAVKLSLIDNGLTLYAEAVQ